jgi:hypothetical protein
MHVTHLIVDDRRRELIAAARAPRRPRRRRLALPGPRRSSAWPPRTVEATRPG